MKSERMKEAGSASTSLSRPSAPPPAVALGRELFALQICPTQNLPRSPTADHAVEEGLEPVCLQQLFKAGVELKSFGWPSGGFSSP